MVADLAVYTVVHQPRRLKLPAQPIPRGASVDEIAHCLFDERMNERYFRKVAHDSYYPAAQMFLDMVQQGMKLSIGFSLSFIRQAKAWDSQLMDLFRELVAHENVELIGVEPYHSLLYLFDLPAFVTWMQDMMRDLELVFGKRPVVTDTTGMYMSGTLYSALDAAGFQGALIDGLPQLMDWREATHLYHSGDTRPYVIPIDTKHLRRSARKGASSQDKRMSGPQLLTRHVGLSEDIRYRFSNHSWSSYPLYADTYADWISQTSGDMMLLGWDIETFGEHQHRDSGIFEFMRAMPAELKVRGVNTYTASELIERHQDQSSHLPLPISPTWIESGLVKNETQNTILQLMSEVYGIAQLTDNPDLVDLAIWLSQSDNLLLMQWSGSRVDRDASDQFMPSEWSALDTSRLCSEEYQVYINTLAAMQPYLPAQLLRQPERKATRRKEVYVEQEPALSYVARRAY
jgi:alpha-amylase